jgi:uncharacterized protein YgiM (DUF1202 family)
MWKSIRIVLGAGVGLALVAATALAAAKEMSVSSSEVALRAKPGNLEPAAATLKYGNRVQVIDEKGLWAKVTVVGGGATGWVHMSSLTKQAVSMKSGQETAAGGASSGEIMMAGKGWSPEVEKSYRAKNPAIDFAWVDRMEKWKTSPQAMREFLKAGKVEPKEGDVK